MQVVEPVRQTDNGSKEQGKAKQKNKKQTKNTHTTTATKKGIDRAEETRLKLMKFQGSR